MALGSLRRLEYINQTYDSVTKMILVCPSCDTRYFTDDAALGSEGRKVRCTSCGHSWFAKPEGAVASAEGVSLTREQVERLRQSASAGTGKGGPHAEFRARELQRKRRNRLIAAGAAWSMALVVFGTATASAVVFRNQVAETWPKTSSIYTAIGLPVNRFGLDFEEVAAKRSFDGTTPVLNVTGFAVNKGETPRAAPRIRISLRDEAGEEVGAWTDDLPVKAIGAGERTAFASRIVAPPVETYRLSVTFATETETEAAGALRSGEADVGLPEAAPPHGPAEGSGHAPEAGGHGETSAAPETGHH
jgi:predicted Zn finger-like uncharacterized protein